MKKFISITLILGIILSMFGMTAVFASDDLTITYWNADSTTISFDFSTAIDEATLEGKISLTKDGVAVPFTYEKNMVNDSVYVAGSSTESAPEKGLSYTITPTGGIALESVYTLTIGAGVASSDGTLTMATAFTKQFMVHKLFSDNFDSYNNTDNLISTAWTNVTPANVDMTAENGKMKLVASATGNNNIVYPNAADLNWSDYTFEAEITVFPNETKENKCHVFQVFAVTPEAYGKPDLTVSPMVEFSTRDFNKMGQSTLKGSTTTGKYYFYTIESGYKDNEARVSKFAIKGNNAKFYLDGKQTLEAKTNTSTAGRFGFSPRMNTSYGSASYYVDNVIVTKAIDVTDIGDLAVTYWNADSKTISVDFSAPIDEASLAGKIALTKDGVAVPFTYEKNMVNDSIYVASSSTESAPGKGLSYTITPTGGVAVDSVYHLTIDSGVMSGDSTLILANAFSKTFKVEKLFSDDFESYNDTDKLITSAWYNNKPENISMTAENGKMKLDVTATGNHNIIYPYAADNNWSDYTFEAEITVFPNETKENKFHQFQMFAAAKDSTPDLLTCPMVEFGTRDFNKMGQSTLKGSTTTGKYYFYTIESGYKDNEARVSKFAIKSNNAKFYLDGKQTLEAKTNTSTAGRFGFSPRMSTSYGSASYYVDNVMVTKATEITGVVIGSLNITDASGNTIPNISNVSSVKGKLTIINATNTSKPIKVVFAMYNDDGLANIKVADETSIAANTTLDVNLDEIATNGATTIKAFVWDNFQSIIPYGKPKEF